MSGHLFNPGPQQQPQMVLAQPINDVQLVALVASNLNAATPTDAVAQAVEIVAEAVIQTQELPGLIRQKKKERAD